MKGDFSRLTFDPRKHYRAVYMQQGRVQLDSDWNAANEISLHRTETETRDVVGECGVPEGDAAFGVVTGANGDKNWLKIHRLRPPEKGNFFLTKGRAYVHGILVENDESILFSDQPDAAPFSRSHIKEPGRYQLYLDVWQRHITAIEDPSIREVALGGPDTTTRTKTIWQVRLAGPSDNLTCDSELPANLSAPKGKLRARTQPKVEPKDPCEIPLGAGYKRLENQLYRVEIHRGGNLGSPPTFVWSRDNGIVVVAIEKFEGDKVTATSLGRDDVLGLHEGNWVEVLDDAHELAGKPGVMAEITKIEPGNILTLSPAVTGFNGGYPKLRRWDSKDEVVIPATSPTANEGYLEIEDGIEIKFELKDGETFRTGDYWLIPARTAEGNIEWPEDEQGHGQPAALSPFGIKHYYCQLAVLDFDKSGSVSLIKDCRKLFPPLTELPEGRTDPCCSVSIGEGESLQSAIDLGKDKPWWTVCIRPGRLTVEDTVTIEGMNNLTIKGCGPQSRIIGEQKGPLLFFKKGTNIKITGLEIESSAADPRGIICFTSCQKIAVTECAVVNAEKSAGPLLVLEDCRQVKIHNNELWGLPAIRGNGTGWSVRENHISGGGIQILPPSQRVEIESNVISRGEGAGIQLGREVNTANGFATMMGVLSKRDSAPEFPEPKLKLVSISHNLISEMTGSGIITDTSFNSKELGFVENLLINDNEIRDCAKTADVNLSKNIQVGGGIIALGLIHSQIKCNLITQNGSNEQSTCGIFAAIGSDLSIAENFIVENGAPGNEKDPYLYQAGITALGIVGSSSSRERKDRTLGHSAIRLDHNEVICPSGPALVVIARGSVMVDANTFVTGEPKSQSEELAKELIVRGKMGLCVHISNNRTFSAKAKTLLLTFEDRMLFHNNQVTFINSKGETMRNTEAIDTKKVNPAFLARTSDKSAEILKTALGFWESAVFSVLLNFTEISITGNQFRADVAGKSPNFIHVGSEGSVIRAIDNGFFEEASNPVSYLSLANVMNLTTNNQGSHLIIATGPKNLDVGNLTLNP